MYCKECGVQILDNSKFCSHCGHKQAEEQPSLNEGIKEITIEKEITRQVVEAHKSSLSISKKKWGYYLVWTLFHLLLLLVFSGGAFDSYNSNNGIEDFWPLYSNSFGSSDYYSSTTFAERYDITEFLVYTIFPLVILVINNLTKNQKEENQLTNTSENKQNPDISFEA